MPEHADAAPASAPQRRFLTFRLADDLYALPAEAVAEVIRSPAAARVPHSPPALLGLANLRGSVLPLVSLRRLLRAADAVGDRATTAVVIAGTAPVALAVDAVEGFIAVDAHRVETREAELGAREGELLRAAVHSTDHSQAAKVLDLDALLAAAFAQRRRAERRSPMVPAVAAPAAAPRAEPDAGPAAMLVTFDVAGQEFALELEHVQEILPAPSTPTALPRSETLVLGVTSWRERLLPLLSLRGLLGFPPAAAASGREKVIVMKLRGAQVGLLADRANAVLVARPATIDAVPPVLAARTGGEARVRAIHRGDEGRRLVSILLPDQLFREDVMRRLAERNDQDEPAIAAAGAVEERQFLVFRLGADEFALPIEAVDEVGAVPQKIARLPKTPKFLEGVANLRGEVLPVIDQRRRFDLPAAHDAARPHLVVVRSERHRAGLIVDAVLDVLRVPARSVEPAPELTAEIAQLVRGVITLGDARRMVLVLDPLDLLTPAERRRLDEFQKARRDET